MKLSFAGAAIRPIIASAGNMAAGARPMAAAGGNAPCRAWRRWPGRTIAASPRRWLGRRSRVNSAMEFLPCVFMLALLGAVAVWIAYAVKRQERTRAALAAIAERFHGQFCLIDGRECVRLSLEGHLAVLKFMKLGGEDETHFHTQFVIDWPDPELRCEVYPDQFSGFRKLKGMDDIEI